jgi:hypothetical protein
MTRARTVELHHLDSFYDSLLAKKAVCIKENVRTPYKMQNPAC